MSVTTQRDIRYEDDLFDKAFDEHVKGIPDHKFKHKNESMGCFIYNKDHYKSEMKKRGLVPYDEMERLAEEWDNNHRQQSFDSLSPHAMGIIKSIKMTADKNGNVKLDGRAIDALVEIGAIKPRSEYIPEEMKDKGGFN